MRTLMDLPMEILHAVAQEVSPQNVGCAETWSPCAATCCGNAIVSLSRLSKTCKTFRDVAQPRLFRYFFQPEPFSLLDILCSRPDLAACVQSLCVGMDWYTDGDHCSSSESTVYNSLLKTHFEDGDAKRLLLYTESSEDDTEEAFAALAIAQASNINRLTIVECRWQFPIYRQGSLPYLTQLELSSNVTEGGVEIDSIRGILAAAPSLRMFTGYGVNGVSNKVFHGNLSTVISRGGNDRESRSIIYCTIVDSSRSVNFRELGLQSRRDTIPCCRRLSFTWQTP